MKLSKQTLELVQNFAAINQSLYFFKGKTLRVRNVQNTIVAKATLEEAFPKDFAIYDTNALLRVFGLFENAEIEFEDKNLTVTDGVAEARYVYADPSVVTKPKEKDFAFPADIWTVEFQLEEKTMSNLLNAASVMKLGDIVFNADGVVVKDTKNNSSDQYKAAIKYKKSTTPKVPADFEIFLKPESLLMLPGDYTVTLCEKMICQFKHNTKDLSYWVASMAPQA